MPHGRGASPRQLRHNDLPSAAGFGDFQHSLPHSAHGMDCLPFLDGKGSSPSSAMKLSSPTPYPWVAHTEPYALRGRRAAWGRVSAPGGFAGCVSAGQSVARPLVLSTSSQVGSISGRAVNEDRAPRGPGCPAGAVIAGVCRSACRGVVARRGCIRGGRRSGPASAASACLSCISA